MGGKTEAPKTYSPQEQAMAQIMVDNASAQRAERAAAEQRAREKAEKDADIARTAGDNNRLYSQGTAYGTQRSGNLGYDDTYGLLDTYNRELNSVKARVPQQSGDVGSYYDYDNLWSKATNEVQSAQQMKLDNQFRNLTPVGWERNYFADTSDDDILDAILGEQYGSTFDTIDAARARGQLSSGGFDNTLRGLDQKKLAARAQLEDIGLGVLGGYRDELDSIRDDYSDQIGNYKLGQNIDLSQFTSAIDERKNSLMQRLKGDIYRQLGDTQLFSADSLMAKGGSAAGVSNNPLRNAFRNVGSNALEPERSSGTTGVF